MELKHICKKTEEHLAFLLYTECTETTDKIDKVLASVFMRWKTSDEGNYSKLNEPEDDVSEASEWLRIEPFSSIVRRIGAVRKHYPTKPFMYPIHTAKHRFYVNRFGTDFEKTLQIINSISPFFEISNTTRNLVIELW